MEKRGFSFNSQLLYWLNHPMSQCLRIPIMRRLTLRTFCYIFSALLLAGCMAMIAKQQLDGPFGEASVVERTVLAPDYAEPEYFADIKPILDKRCVVCHGCYDAPCQLKMSSFESIDRGASKNKVYDGKRLLAANLSRLTIDAGSTQQWREEGFFPILNERNQTPEANRQGGVMYRMLQLKQQHPLPDQAILPRSFDFTLNREQQCSKIEEFADYEQNYPLWGMPYGLPALEEQQRITLQRWLETGAKADFPGVVPTVNQLELDQWERFFNGPSLKQQLVSRYIFEHLFLANLYFEKTQKKVGDSREFFKLVRSKTPPGTAIENISARRPFEDPDGPFYYRLQRIKSTILAKQNMPYLLNKARMKRWQSLFLEPDYTVTRLPGYQPEKASNPFITFAELPVKSRYEFMLDEAQFTIMGFIKGPVCRGQVALNVINDHFWVLFMDPVAEEQYTGAGFLEKEAQDLQLPAEKESNALLVISSWLKYSKLEKRYMHAKESEFQKAFHDESMINLSLLWDGNGNNQNAALTIYRHFDSSTVKKGLLGDVPKTAWVIGYPLMERIHYLLVAGFDVYGNVGHQLLTRLYMDFLRMEGEYNFLRFLPKQVAQQELDFWYRGEESSVELYLQELHDRSYQYSGIEFTSDNPKREFFEQVRKAFGPKVIAPDIINTRPATAPVAEYQRHLQQLARVRGWPLEYLSEQSLLRLTLANGESRLISMIRNRAHSNVSHLFGEQQRLIPQEQTLSVLEGVVGAYPNTFYDVHESQLPVFVQAVANLGSEQDYRLLLGQYGVRRSHKSFWSFSDDIHATYLNTNPVEAGLLDYNRLENR